VQGTHLARLGALAAAAAIISFFVMRLGAQSPGEIMTIDDSALRAVTTTVGGAPVLPTSRTVAHWWGSTLDPHNGVTYGYNMVGAAPNACSGSACSVTIDVDITPVNLSVGGMTFSGDSVLAATLASPVFTLNDYGSTPFATAAGSFPNSPRFV